MSRILVQSGDWYFHALSSAALSLKLRQRLMMAAAAAYIQAPKQFCCSMVENKMIARTQREQKSGSWRIETMAAAEADQFLLMERERSVQTLAETLINPANI